MKIAEETSSLNQFKSYGSCQGFLITIPGSIAFATIVLFLSPYTWSNIVHEFIGHFFLGMICSFVPAILGSAFLASQIYRRYQNHSVKSGIIQGALTGLCSMLTFNLLLTPTPFVNSHLIDLKTFILFFIISLIIATLSGTIVCIQLTKKILKA